MDYEAEYFVWSIFYFLNTVTCSNFNRLYGKSTPLRKKYKREYRQIQINLKRIK